MSGTTSFLFNGAPTPPQPTGSDSSTSYPLWLQNFVYNTANSATNLANQPYTPYGGPQVATPSDTTQAAWGQAVGQQGAWQPNLSNAGALVGAASAPITGDDINRYMSPYMDNVVGGLTTAANKNFFDTVLPQVQDRFVSAGQSRSPQEMQATNNSLYQNNTALNSSIANAEQTGYQGALNTALQQKSQEQQAGATFGQLGALTQQLGAADTGQLAAAGQAQDTTNQANINAAMNNFYGQQQWPYQNLGFASNIIRGLPVNTNTQVVGSQYNPGQTYAASPISAFAGATTGAKALGLRRGGHVRLEG